MAEKQTITEKIWGFALFDLKLYIRGSKLKAPVIIDLWVTAGSD